MVGNVSEKPVLCQVGRTTLLTLTLAWSRVMQANIYCIIMLGCVDELIVGDGTAVLIRALEPTEGLETMQKNRGLADKGDKVKPHELCNGPSKLTKVHVVTAFYLQ